MALILKEHETMQDVIDRLFSAYDLVSDIAPASYWYANLSERGEIKDIHFSENMRKMLGYKSKEEFPDDLALFLHFTHPDDEKIVMGGSLNFKDNPNEKYDVNYRIRRASGDYMWCKVTGVFVRDVNEKVVGIYGAFIDISERKDLEQKKIFENNRNLLSLEDKFEYLYDVSLTTGKYIIYVNETTNYEGIKLRFVEYEDFFSDSQKNIEDVVHPMDKEIAHQVLNKDFIIKNLENKPFVEYKSRVFVEGKPIWFKTRISYKDEDKTNVIIGVFNIDEEVKAEQKDLKLRNELINQMLGGESVYLVNPQTDDLKVIYRNRYLTENYKDFEKYSESINRYINSDVYPYDREKMTRVTDVSSLIQILSEKKELEEMYRDISSGNPLWYKMRATEISDTEILLGFANVDKEYLDDTIHKRIEEDYFAMFLVDADLQTMKILKRMALNTEINVGDVFPYEEAVLNMAMQHEGDTKAFFERISDIEYVKRQLSKEGKASFTYKFRDNWVTLELLVTNEDEDGVVHSFAFGFKLSDYLVSEREELQAKLNANRIVVEALSEDFGCVNYVMLNEGRETDEDIGYRISPLLKRLIPGWEKEKSFAKKAILIRDHVVYEPDRESFYEAVKREKIIEKLKDSEVYFVNFRCFFDGEIKYYQMKATAVRENDVLTGVVIGFHSVDEAVKKEIAVQEKLKEALDNLARDNAFTKFFLEPYVSAYYVNLEKMECQAKKRSSKLALEYPDIDHYISSMGRYIETEVHPDDREKISILINKEALVETLKQKKNFNFTYRKISEETEKIFQCDLIRGEDINHIAFGFKDVTETIKKREEDERKLREALVDAQSANRAKTTFLNNMSHDIRTPMNAIIGYTNLAKDNVNDSKKVSGYLKKIGQSSEVLLDLINDVLDMSRIESGRMSLDNKPEKLEDILDSLKSILAPLVYEKKIDFSVEAPLMDGAKISVDRLRLNQVLLNVCSNSIKYTKKGGKVSLSLSKRNALKNGKASFEFIIKDNGIGMDKDYLKTIFEPFSRERSSVVSGIQGTGLGMTISKKIVEMLGGTITIKSEKGMGTETKIRIPFEVINVSEDASEKQTAMQKKEALDKLLKGKKILIVEDNEMNVEIVDAILKKAGCITDISMNGFEALEKISKAKPKDFDVILMDVQMPKMSGYEATKRIRALGTELSKLPIIAMTANAFEEDKKKALEVGMNAHLSKPINVKEMKETIGKFL